jgi:3-deoxy-manno-octulosonate cytidylyltransferase (CMP-KDO synthetase)
MKTVIVIPSRYQSTRLPGKPLLDIGGEAMVVRVWRRCCAVRGADRVVVATDDERIAAVVEKAGGEVKMTAASHPSGSDRVCEAVAGEECDLVVNVQGDEPFLDPGAVDGLIDFYRDGGDAPAATLATTIGEAKDLFDPAVVKVLIGEDGRAVYFSRFPIPFRREMWEVEETTWRGRAGEGEPFSAGVCYRHLGVYAFRPDFLRLYTSWRPTPGERAERLEQLRILEHGERIQVIVTDYQGQGVDTPEDLERARLEAGEGG